MLVALLTSKHSAIVGYPTPPPQVQLRAERGVVSTALKHFSHFSALLIFPFLLQYFTIPYLSTPEASILQQYVALFSSGPGRWSPSLKASNTKPVIVTGLGTIHTSPVSCPAHYALFLVLLPFYQGNHSRVYPLPKLYRLEDR